MAAASLGRLTLDLLVRLGSFEQGLNRAERQASQSANNMSDAFRGFGDQIRESLGGTQLGSLIGDVTTRLEGMQGSVLVATAGLAGLAAGGTVLAVAGLSKMAIETAKADSEMAMLAMRAKVGIENFQIFTYAAEQLGISQDQLGSIFADVQEKLGEFSATGGGGAADFFDALKNNTKLTDDQIKAFSKTLQGKDGVEAVQMLKDKLDDLGASSQEQRFVFESLASDLTNLMPLFSEGGAKIEEYGKALQDAGVIKSKEAIQQSQILAAQTQAVNLQFQGAKSQLVQGFMPALVNVADAMFGTSKNGNQLRSVGDGLGTIFKSVAWVGIGLSAVIQGLGDGFGALAAMAVSAASGDIKGVVAIYKDSEVQFNRIVEDSSQRLEKLWAKTESGKTVTGTLTNAILQLNQAQNLATTGLKINTKEADENAKAAEKQAVAKAKAAKEQENLNKVIGAAEIKSLGLRLKSSETIAGGGVKEYTAQFAKMTQDLLGDQLQRFTALNDGYHQGKGGKHPIGQAFDFTVKDAAEANSSIQRIQEMAKKYGFAIKTLNEYADPSKNATGGHIHVSVLGYKGSSDALKEANTEIAIISKANADATRIQEERAKNQLAINYKYATEEQKMDLDNQEAIKAIKLAYAEGDPSRQKYLDLQKAAYDQDVAAFEKSLQKKREAAWEKINELHRDAAMASQNWNSTAAEMMGTGAIYQLDQQRNTRYAESSDVFETQSNVLNDQELEPGADLEAIAAQREAIWQAHNDRMAMIDADYWTKTKSYQLGMAADVFGGLSGVLLNFVDESSSSYRILVSIQKAANLASVLMNSVTAISAAWASAPFPYNIPAVAMATVQTGALQATLQAFTPQGFANGGYTGAGGKYDPAGIVHKGEVVFSQADVARWGGVGNVEAMRTGKGFAAGGVVDTKVLDMVNNKALNSYISDQQEANAKASSPTVVDNNTKVLIFDDRQAMEQEMMGPTGEKIFMYHWKRNQSKLRN